MVEKIEYYYCLLLSYEFLISQQKNQQHTLNCFAKYYTQAIAEPLQRHNLDASIGK